MPNATKTVHNATNTSVHREIRTHTPSTAKESLAGWVQFNPLVSHAGQQ